MTTKQKVGAAIAAVLILGLVFGGDDAVDEPAAPTATAPAPQPEPEPEPAPAPDPEPAGPPMDLGDDPYLDGLWAACSMDDYDACDDLYWESPLGSEYEAFALERLDELDAREPAPAPERPATDLVMGLVWAGMDTEARAEICLGVGLFGADGAAEMIVAEAPEFPVDEVADWLARKCR